MPRTPWVHKKGGDYYYYSHQFSVWLYISLTTPGPQFPLPNSCAGVPRSEVPMEFYMLCFTLLRIFSILWFFIMNILNSSQNNSLGFQKQDTPPKDKLTDKEIGLVMNHSIKNLYAIVWNQSNSVSFSKRRNIRNWAFNFLRWIRSWSSSVCDMNGTNIQRGRQEENENKFYNVAL